MVGGNSIHPGEELTFLLEATRLPVGLQKHFLGGVERLGSILQQALAQTDQAILMPLDYLPKCILITFPGPG